MNEADVWALTATHPFASGLSPDQVDAIVDRAEVCDVAAGTTLFHEGRAADHCYLVIEGHIAIEIHVPNRGPVTVGTVGPGELLGWSWFFPPHLWRFDATARTDARVVALDAQVVRVACDDDDALAAQLGYSVVRTMTSRLEATRHQLLDVYRHGAP